MVTKKKPIPKPAFSDADIQRIFDDGGMFIEGARFKRFRAALFEICNAQESLLSSAKMFASTSVDVGEIDAQYAVETFSEYFYKRVSLLLATLVNEDLKNHPLPASEGAE